MAIATSKLTTQGQIRSDKFLVHWTGRSSSEDLHHTVFDVPPEPRTLKELKEGISTHIKKRHPRA